MTETDVRRLRETPRLKLFEPTEMSGPNGSIRAHILDLSATGALVHAVRPPSVGDHVQLRIAGASRYSRVMWVEDRKFGVAFRLPLAAADIDAVLGRPKERAATPLRQVNKTVA
jgi:hypothetical protein